MAGVEQYLSLVATVFRTPLATALQHHGIVDAADICCMMSKKDAHKVGLELLGDLYTPEFDDAL